MSNGEHDVDHILQQVRSGSLSIEEAKQQLAAQHVVDLGFAKIDHSREARTGFPEVIYAEGKSNEQLVKIASVHEEMGEAPLIFSRLSADKAALITEAFPDFFYHEAAQMGRLGQGYAHRQEKIALISAGSSDYAVLQEAQHLLEILGYEPDVYQDCGVAGLHRLLAQLPALKKAQCIIAVAGMEGALPSVLAGLVKAPVIAVPTSVGYGTHKNGQVALHAMLNACAPGITVVNIDNGFGAAAFAHKLFQHTVKGPTS